MNRILLALLAAAALALPGAARAVPMPDRPVQLTNPDGTTFRARLLGDEFLSWAEDAHGYAMVFDPADRAWHYARLSVDGQLVPTPARPGQVDPRRLAIRPHLRPGKLDLAQAAGRRLRAAGGDLAPRVRTSGAVKMPVFLVKFRCVAIPGQDCSALATNPTFKNTDFEPLFNGSGSSVKDYFLKASGGKLTLTTQLATGSGVVDGWIPLQDRDQAYSADATPAGDPRRMIEEAVRYLSCDDTLPNVKPPQPCTRFDFAQFDPDGDGNIDTVSIIHLGPGEESAGDPRFIHSHWGTLPGGIPTWDGKRILSYHTEPELYFAGATAKITPLGTIVHETGHALGLPDLYDTTEQSAGLGIFSLMASGSWGGPGGDGTVPTFPDAWSKLALGWAQVDELTASAAGVRVSPAPAAAAQRVKRIPNAQPAGQYFLLEVREKAGYDQYLPGAGLAVYHVDENMDDNDDPAHYKVALEQADGLNQLGTDPNAWGDAQDLYPTATNTAFTPTSNPNSKSYANVSSGVSLTAIARDAADVTFNLAIVAPVGTSANGVTCLLSSECKSTICTDSVCCDQPCSAGLCDGCSKKAGAAKDGVCQHVSVPCDDTNACTSNDACVQGLCIGTPKTCPASDSCHETSTCNPQNGVCSRIAKADGTACEDGDECTTGDTCTGGVCGGTATTVCLPPEGPEGCHTPSECKFQKCAAFGMKPNTTVCSDNNACTTGDACYSGLCQGLPVVCPKLGDCYEESKCDPKTGVCSTPVMRPNGSSCDDKNPCTANDSCAAGTCKGSPDPAVTTCPPPDGCHEAGVCSAAGECVAPKKADDTVCDDGNLCTLGDKCLAGVCTGTPMNCAGTVSDPCKERRCVPESGSCMTVAKAEGASCTATKPCESNGQCIGGACKGEPLLCPPPDDCHQEGTCITFTGKCPTSYPKKADGAKCYVNGNPGKCQSPNATSNVSVCVADPLPDSGVAEGPDASTPGDSPDTGTAPPVEPEKKGGCGCGAGGAGAMPFAALGLLLALPRRRRS